MNDSDNKEAHSYKDPMAPRVEAAKERREALEEEYPRVSDVYDGFYVRLKELSDEESRFFLGAEAIIGSPLAFDGETAQLVGGDGAPLTQISGATAKRLKSYASKGWNIKVLLSTTYFRAQDKSAVADVAFLCWKPIDDEINAALMAFSKGISERLAAGSRAEVRLTQKEFVHVLQSQGTWYLTPNIKREPLEKGTVVYKARRSGVERITAYALRHRSGCNSLAILFWIILAAGIVFLVWFFFFK